MKQPTVLCPSAKPDTPGSIALGVMTGTVEEPQFIHFQRPLPVTEELLALANPVTPTEVFRFAGTCAENGCTHFDGTNCRLVQNIVDQRPTVTLSLPSCHIRSSCRWWQQEGREACFRCPQVVTDRPSQLLESSQS
jgi:hypothetical protein